jgi:hypothetical protein
VDGEVHGVGEDFVDDAAEPDSVGGPWPTTRSLDAMVDTRF